LHLRAVRARHPEKRGKPACKWARAPKRQSCSTKLYTWSCKTDSTHRVPNIPDCVPQTGNPATRAPLRALSTGQGLEFAQDFCPVKESRQSHAATSRIPFRSPRAGTKSVCVCHEQISRPTPSRRLGYSCAASLRIVPSPRPFERSSPSRTAGAGERFRGPLCRWADTCKEKKNMEKPKGDQCLSARAQDGGQTIRVPSVMTRGRLYTPSRLAGDATLSGQLFGGYLLPK